MIESDGAVVCSIAPGLSRRSCAMTVVIPELVHDWTARIAGEPFGLIEQRYVPSGPNYTWICLGPVQYRVGSTAPLVACQIGGGLLAVAIVIFSWGRTSGRRSRPRGRTARPDCSSAVGAKSLSGLAEISAYECSKNDGKRTGTGARRRRRECLPFAASRSARGCRAEPAQTRREKRNSRRPASPVPAV